MTGSPPRIFSDLRRKRCIDRAAQRVMKRAGHVSFLTEAIAEDFADRLSFLRYAPQKTGYFGQPNHALTASLPAQGTLEQLDGRVDEEQPYPVSGFDLIASINRLGSVNDLPGALIHLRNALAPGGLAMASFPAAGSLPKLRAAIFAAEAERPAARMHPLVDARGGAQLLQRAGWKDPVVDLQEITVAYRSFDQLIADLRDEALTSVLQSVAPPLTRTALDRARQAFMAQADADGRVVETFAILTLTGRRSLAGT